MILPVVAYGHPVLKHVAEEISPDYPDFKQLVDDMFETMYYSEGVGLAAPQINKSIRLFVIDTDPFSEKYPEGKGIKKVFVNPEIMRCQRRCGHSERDASVFQILMKRWCDQVR